MDHLVKSVFLKLNKKSKETPPDPLQKFKVTSSSARKWRSLARENRKTSKWDKINALLKVGAMKKRLEHLEQTKYSKMQRMVSCRMKSQNTMSLAELSHADLFTSKNIAINSFVEDSEENQSNEKQEHAFFDPRGTRMMQWKRIVCIAMLYTLIYVPFLCAFRQFYTVFKVLESLCDIIFTVHIAVRFKMFVVTKYDGVETVIKDFDLVAVEYVRGGFILHLISVAYLPFGAENLLSGHNAFILLKFLKILRVFELHHLIGNLFKTNLESMRYIRLARMLFWLVIMSHIMGCVFYLLACDADGTPVRGSWVFEQGFAQNDSVWYSYVPSIYYMITSLTTVGYGDVYAHTLQEKFVASVVMVVGSVLYAVILGSVVKIVEKLSHGAGMDKVLEGVSRWLRQKKVEEETATWVLNSHRFQCGIDNGTKHALDAVSPIVRRYLKYSAYAPILLQSDSFVSLSDSFLRELVQGMELHANTEMSTLAHAGDVGVHVFFVQHGRCAIMGPIGENPIGHYGVGEYFGLVAALIPEILTPNTIVSLTNSILYALKGSYIRSIAKYFPDEFEELKSSAMKHELVPLLDKTSKEHALSKEEVRKMGSRSHSRGNEKRGSSILIGIRSATLEETGKALHPLCEVFVEGVVRFSTCTRWMTHNPMWEQVCQIGPIDESSLRKKNILFNIYHSEKGDMDDNDDDDDCEASNYEIIGSCVLSCESLFERSANGVRNGLITLDISKPASKNCDSIPFHRGDAEEPKQTLSIRYNVDCFETRLRWHENMHSEIRRFIKPWTSTDDVDTEESGGGAPRKKRSARHSLAEAILRTMSTRRKSTTKSAWDTYHEAKEKNGGGEEGGGGNGGN
eukprot:g3110.t1